MAIKHTIGNPLCECIHCSRRRTQDAIRKSWQPQPKLPTKPSDPDTSNTKRPDRPSAPRRTHKR